MSKPLFAVIVRWIVAIALLWVAVRLLVGAANGGDYLGAFAKCLYGFAAMMSGVILLGPELVRWAAIPIQRLLTSILFPGGSGTPPVDYTLARFYRRQARHDESVEQYLKIVHYHPQEIAAYLEGIDAAIAATDPESARKLYRSGMRRLRTPAARHQLELTYKSATQQEPMDRLAAQ